MPKVKYTLEELYNLWIIWISKYNINVQQFYDKYNLDGSFIMWLEKRKI